MPSLDAAQCETMVLEVAQHRSPPESDSLTVSSSSDEEQARGSEKRKRCAAAECPERATRAMPRSVSFSKSSVIRVTEIVVEASSPLPVEMKTDHEATIKHEDGPRPAATLLDDLIVVRSLLLPPTVQPPLVLHGARRHSAQLRLDERCSASLPCPAETIKPTPSFLTACLVHAGVF